MYEKRPMSENYTIKSRRPSTPPKDKGTRRQRLTRIPSTNRRFSRKIKF